MRKFFLLLGFVFFVGLVFLSLKTIKQKVSSDINAPLDTQSMASPTVMPTVDVKKNPREKEVLFVPYWTMSSDTISPEDYDTVVYFGITPTENGINESEPGYTSLSKFIQRTPSWHKRLLTLRMLDSKTNFAVLDDEKKQAAVIQDFMQTAQDNGFDGVILDLEVSALPFDSVISQINTFTKKMSQSARDAKLSFSMMIYGDTFYRVRPFEVKTLGAFTDQLYIMAYDFSKAKGNPGPNFPLGGKDVYGYDYASLVKNFTDVVPAKKLTVVFGMYGYDWTVDDKDVSTGLAEAVSLNKIEQTIISSCSHISCNWERDSEAGEIKAEYKDENNARHIVWFEDQESVNRKKEFLRKQGITTYGFWAYSYF